MNQSDGHIPRSTFASLLPLPGRDEVLKAIIFMSAALTAYFLTRLINLTIVPIFTDEAIYLRWAQIALRDSQFRFISLTDGKQPLYVWLVMVAMKWINDPLVAGRFVSALTGAVSLMSVWLLARELFDRQTGYLVALVYLFLPINLLYDRMALMESLLFSFGTLSVLFAVLLAKHLRLDLAMVLGGVIGGALLTKSPGVFYLYLFPASLVFFPWRKSGWFKRLAVWLILAGVVVALAQLYLNILRLSPWLHQVKTKDQNFVVTFSEFRADPWHWFPGNWRAFRHWIVGYLSWPVIIFVGLGVLGSLRKSRRGVLLLLAYFLVPLLTSAAFGKIIYARYLMFFMMPLVIFAGRGMSLLFSGLISRFKLSWFSAGLLSFICLLPVLRTDFFLLTDPHRASIPDNDKNQYIDAWPSGYGINETVEFIRAKAEQGKVTVATEGTFGMMPNALELYLVDHPNVEILPYWPVSAIPEEVLNRARLQPTYFIFNEMQEIPEEFPLRLVQQYPKGNGKDFLHLFEVVASQEDASVPARPN